MFALPMPALRPVLPLLASTTVMVCGIGLGHLLIPLRADLEGWNASTIGAIAATYATAYTLGCLFAPMLVKLLGHLRTTSLLLIAMAAAMVALSQFVNPLTWALLRGVVGFAAACIYTIIEAWLNETSPNEARGSIMSWYMLACLTGTISGQYMLPLSDPARATLFFAGAAAFIGAIIPLALSRMTAPAPASSARPDFSGVWRSSPSAAAGNFITGGLFGIYASFAAVHAGKLGHDGATIATLLMVSSIGGLMMQFPFGRLSDRIDRRWVMAGIGLIGLCCTMTGMLVMPSQAWALGAIYFFIGGTLYPAYSINVAHANDHAGPGAFVGISGAMMVIYGTGAVIAPLICGPLIDRFGYAAFFACMVAGYFAYLVYPMWRMARRPPPPHAAEVTDNAFSSGAARRP
jgi:MFS family permease